MVPRLQPPDMGTADWLAARLDPGSVRAFLAGDLLAILAFLVAGELRHGVNPAVLPGYFAETAAPFYLGWAVAGPLAGAYTERARRDRRRLVAATAGGWVLAAVGALLLRATEAFHGDADPVFFVVVVGFGGGLLVGWRLLRSALG